MATYPTLPTSYGSDPSPLPGMQVDRAEDDFARVRLSGTDRSTIPVKHEMLDAREGYTLMQFYAENRSVSFDFPDQTDSVTRTCVFLERPTIKAAHLGRWEFNVKLGQI